MQRPQLICLMGPTASGKTDLAIALARERHCELISVDSALVYRGLDIGSAKPDYPHHLIDIRDPQQVYSAAEFVRDAGALVEDIVARGKTPLLVGGTMLYFKAFLQGLAQMPAADAGIRAEIEAQAQAQGWAAIHKRLERVDPEAAARIHPHHSQRLCRALEVYLASGTPLSQWHRVGQAERAQQEFLQRFDVRQIGLAPVERRVLHERIERRFENMLAAGLLEEVRTLYDRGDLHAALPAVRAVGYRQLWEHLEGTVTFEEAVQNAVSATRQLARRQLTWLRKWADLQWIMTNSEGNVVEMPGFEEYEGGLPSALAVNYLAIPPT